MDRRAVPLLASIGILAVAAGTAFAYRVTIADTLAAARKPALPKAQPYVPPAAPVPPATEAEPTPAPAPAPAPKPSSAPKPAPSPEPKPEPAPAPAVAEKNLAVPFTPQAPHANWDMPYQEACEEASLIMAAAYFEGLAAFTPEEADRRILELVAWQEATFGYYEDTTAEEVARTAREYFKLKDVRTFEVASIEDVKREVAAGRVVIVPAAGRLLKNPYFRGEGPKYHMLVVKGYTKDGLIISNDPGTRRGADFLYDPAVLFEAIHDWNGGDVANGAKVAVSIGG